MSRQHPKIIVLQLIKYNYMQYVILDNYPIQDMFISSFLVPNTLYTYTFVEELVKHI